MVTNHLRAPYGVFFTKNRTPVRRPAGGRKNRTIFYHFLAPEIFKNLLSNRPMPVRAPDDARPGAGRCDMGRTATGERRRVYAEVHIAFT